jgi:AcrR family transcriptional regulator
MIRTAADLFHKQRVPTTSPDEIIEASRTRKGQFYHYFRSKEGLIRQDLSLIFEVVKNKLAAFFVREKEKKRRENSPSKPTPSGSLTCASLPMQGAMLMGKVKRSSQTCRSNRPRGFSAPQEPFSKELNVASVVPVGPYS